MINKNLRVSSDCRDSQISTIQLLPSILNWKMGDFEIGLDLTSQLHDCSLQTDTSLSTEPSSREDARCHHISIEI